MEFNSKFPNFMAKLKLFGEIKILSLLNFPLKICSQRGRPPTLRTYLTYFEYDDWHKNWWQARHRYKLMHSNPQLCYLTLFLRKSKNCRKYRVCNSELIDFLNVWFLKYQSSKCDYGFEIGMFQPETSLLIQPQANSVGRIL